jgi:hypothetical protein
MPVHGFTSYPIEITPGDLEVTEHQQASRAEVPEPAPSRPRAGKEVGPHYAAAECCCRSPETSDTTLTCGESHFPPCKSDLGPICCGRELNAAPAAALIARNS